MRRSNYLLQWLLSLFVVLMFSGVVWAKTDAAAKDTPPKTDTKKVVSTASPAKININTATAKELEENLTGIGPVKAAAIVEYRKANGPFKSIEDLEKVKGIGPAIIEQIKNNIVLK